MSIIRNFTPHAVTIFDADGITPVATFPSGGVVRAQQTAQTVGSVNGIEVVQMQFGDVEGLPDPQSDVYLIVSLTAANAAKAHGRTTDDLLITADPVRNENGQIIGCKKFSCI